jgi:hypothetical protein
MGRESEPTMMTIVGKKNLTKKEYKKKKERIIIITIKKGGR